MNDFIPTTGTEARWDAACERLNSYLRALGMDECERQNEIILQILQSAAARHATQPELDPTTLAMEEAHEAIEGWFARISAGTDHYSISGRVSLLISDAARKWPKAFLADEVPPEFVQAMRASKVQAGPNLQISSMVPRPLDDDPNAGVRPSMSDDGTPWIIPLVVFCSLLGGIVIFLSR